MITLIFRCPATGLNAQAWLSDDSAPIDEEIYETVSCLASGQSHLINRFTGKTLGDGDE